MMRSPKYESNLSRLRNRYRGKAKRRFGLGFEGWFQRFMEQKGAVVIRHTRSQFPDMVILHDGKAAVVECKTYYPDEGTIERLRSLCRSVKIPGYIAYLIRVSGKGDVRTLRLMKVSEGEFPLLDRMIR